MIERVFQHPDPGDLLVAGVDGCIKISGDLAPDEVLSRDRQIRAREDDLHALLRRPDVTLAKIWGLRHLVTRLECPDNPRVGVLEQTHLITGRKGGRNQ